MIFSHFGDLGDTLYHLVVIARRGPGELVLYPGRCRDPYTVEKVERIRSFFELQEFVTGVRFGDHPTGIVLDKWRRHRPRGRGGRGRLNLADHACSCFRVPRWPLGTPWLRVDQVHHGPAVLFNRTPRWNGDGSFPWAEAVERWRDVGAFVGTAEEHRAFVDQFGEVEHYTGTETLLDLARLIAGCKLMVCGQSTPRALAEGLAVPVWVEQGDPANTHFERAGAYYDAADRDRVFELEPHLSPTVTPQSLKQDV